RRSRELPRPRGTPPPSGDPRLGLRPRLPGLPRRPGVRENPAERTTRLELDLDPDERPPARRLGDQEDPRHRRPHRDRREFRPPRPIRGGAARRLDADRPTEDPDNLWSQGDGDAARVLDREVRRESSVRPPPEADPPGPRLPFSIEGFFRRKLNRVSASPAARSNTGGS